MQDERRLCIKARVLRLLQHVGQIVWRTMEWNCSAFTLRLNDSMNLRPEIVFPDADAAQRPGLQVLEILLIVLVFFAVAGDPVPHVNESHYLCRLKHFWNPSWCTGDLFLESPEAHLTFAWVFGWATKWLSLPAFAWVGRGLAWTLLAWAWQRLSWRLVPVPLMSVLSAALWVTLTARAHLAGEWVVGGVEAKCFAYVFVLAALAALVSSRWNQVWLLLGAASAFHALVGGWSVVVCGGIWVWEQLRDAKSYGSARRSLVAMIPGLVGGGLIALLGIVPALRLTWNQPPELVAEANRVYVFERLPHHLALLSQPTSDIVRRITRHGAILLVLWWLVRVARPRSLAQEFGMKRATALRRIALFAGGAVLLAMVGFAIELTFWTEPLQASSLLRYYWFRLTDFAVPLAVALYASLLIAVGLRQERRWAAWGLALALAITTYQITEASWQRLVNPVPPADAHVRDYAAWVDVCQWVGQNTPTDAVFLTPRRSQTFKWRTGRAEVAIYKDIPQDARSMNEWYERLRSIYYEVVDGKVEPIRSLGHLGTEQVKKYAYQYGAEYVITDHRRPLEFPVAYWNTEYVVYRIDP
jgi:Domain of unknown function (DUF6798)